MCVSNKVVRRIKFARNWDGNIDNANLNKEFSSGVEGRMTRRSCCTSARRSPLGVAYRAKFFPVS
jgi:hypothetical protein